MGRFQEILWEFPQIGGDFWAQPLDFPVIFGFEIMRGRAVVQDFRPA